MDQKQIAILVKKYEGIPYRHGGRDLTGLDCLGLAHFFYKDCGIHMPDSDGKTYSAHWSKEDPQRYLRGIMSVGTAVSADELQPLDFVYFRIGKNITHGGVMVDCNHFIHVLQRTVVHISPLNWVWKKRLAGARRLT
jgi:Cell wall-associated hydrolases (invasion-associated proteins)